MNDEAERHPQPDPRTEKTRAHDERCWVLGLYLGVYAWVMLFDYKIIFDVFRGHHKDSYVDFLLLHIGIPALAGTLWLAALLGPRYRRLASCCLEAADPTNSSVISLCAVCAGRLRSWWGVILPFSEWELWNPRQASPTAATETVNVTATGIRSTVSLLVFVVVVIGAVVVTKHSKPSTVASIINSPVLSRYVVLLFALYALSPFFVHFYRAFAFNPLRALGRWAIIADPEKIEIPNWIRGTRTFRWERSTLVIIGVYGQMARAAVVDRDTGDTAAFNLPRANLDTLVGVATAGHTSLPEPLRGDGHAAPVLP